MRINGLKFIGCGRNEFTSVSNSTIENSTFQGHNNSKTALDIEDTNLTIMNSSFLFNRVGTCLDIFDASIESNVSVRIAGEILVTNSNVNIIKCNFLENSAEIGGAVYVHNLSNVSINNSTFINNQVTFSSAHIQDCEIKNGIEEIVCTGGAIIMFKSWLNVDGCTFTNNTSKCGDGGALSIQQESIAKVRKSEFHSNKANGSGGALSVDILSNVTIESSEFIMNSANKGGVMYIAIAGRIIGRECVYKSNMAKMFGDVMAMDQSSLFRDHHGQFFNNRATSGGVLYAIRSELSLNDSVFSYNQARGGVLYVLQSSVVLVWLQ